MKILHAIEGARAASGGTTSAYFNLLEAVATHADLDVRGCCPAPASDDASNTTIRDAPAGRFELTGPPGRIRPGVFGRRLAQLVTSCDVLHLHGVWSPDLVHGALAAIEAGVPTVWQPHGMLLPDARSKSSLKKSLFMKLGLARALRGAAAIVGATEHETAESQLPVGSSDVKRFTVPLPVRSPERHTLDALRAAGRARYFQSHPDARQVVFVGRLHPVKRVELTLDALAQAPNTYLTIFGPGDDQYVATLREHATRAHVADRASFAGWLAPADRWEVLAAADALVINSVHENFGYVVAEAAACKTPVAMTDNLSLADEARKHGFAKVASADPHDLGCAMFAAADPAARAALGDAGRRWVESELSLTAVGLQLAAVYRAIAPQSARV